MASHTLAPSIWASFGRMIGGLARYTDHWPDTQDTSSDDILAERDFINEMIWNNPEAFSSELDIQAMLDVHTGRF